MPQKIKIELTLGPTPPLLGICPKDWKQNLEEMFVYSLFTVGKRWKQPRQSKWMMSTDKWMDNILHRYIFYHMMEYHSALKRKGTLTHATAQMNFEEIMLSEINQSWKDKHCMSPLIWDT